MNYFVLRVLIMNIENLFRCVVVIVNYKLPTVLKTEQSQIISHLLINHVDEIAVLPTYSKSLLYVAAPLILDEVCY